MTSTRSCNSSLPPTATIISSAPGMEILRIDKCGERLRDFTPSQNWAWACRVFGFPVALVSSKQCAAQYRLLSRAVHPDKNIDSLDRASAAFQRLNTANDILKTTPPPGLPPMPATFSFCRPPNPCTQHVARQAPLVTSSMRASPPVAAEGAPIAPRQSCPMAPACPPVPKPTTSPVQADAESNGQPKWKCCTSIPEEAADAKRPSTAKQCQEPCAQPQTLEASLSGLEGFINKNSNKLSGSLSARRSGAFSARSYAGHVSKLLDDIHAIDH